MTNSLRTAAHRPRRAAVAAPVMFAAAVLVTFAACGGDGGTAPRTESLPDSGAFAGSVAVGAEDTVEITAARAAPATVQVCGGTGTRFGLAAAGQRSATTAPCASLTLSAATAGQTIRVLVTSAAGGGDYAGCWSQRAAGCELPSPPDAACPGTATAPTAADIPAGYYDAAVGTCGAALVHALHAIVATQTVLGYTNARDSMYDFVDDENDDDVVSDLYDGHAVAGVNSRATALAAGFNAEHVWPQSRGANEDPANSDLHHIFAADSGANSARSNYPFGVVTGSVLWTGPADSTGQRSLLGLDAQSRVVFQPRPAVRGNVARAQLYFYVRYHDSPTPSFTLQDFNAEEATLKAWAKQDPPDAIERERNDRVYRAQGNRNPFVDWPALVDAVGELPDS